MIKKELMINNIPALLWGEESNKWFVAVHGNHSSKTDVPIEILAEEVVPLGYQVLSFDLPGHGVREKEEKLCKVENGVKELREIMEFAQREAEQISLWACSMGVYLSLLAYKDVCLEKSLLLSPVLNMERIIQNMMKWFGITEERLEREEEISTPIGERLYWDYYQYVKANPIVCWEHKSAILYGEKDELCEWEQIALFVQKFGSDIETVVHAKHYFHTAEQLQVYRTWIRKQLGSH